MEDMESRNTHKVYEKDKIGEVQIADEVVAIIAGLAATEVKGVDSMAGNITNELVGKLGMKNLSKGVSEYEVWIQYSRCIRESPGESKERHREHDRIKRFGREY